MENSDFVLSIVIPCYNEKDNIKKIVEKVIESPVKKVSSTQQVILS